MANYLIFQSRDPFEGRDVTHDYDLASDLAKAGNQVTLFLVQNGVLPARKSAFSERLSQLAKDGVSVQAESFSLQERGIAADSLTDGVTSAKLETAVDMLAAGSKAIWV
jgi:sulfur relay (sulfurtransferase) complex TusBCD TusD component (DsrE family)